jgi:hypothetical protein
VRNHDAPPVCRVYAALDEVIQLKPIERAADYLFGHAQSLREPPHCMGVFVEIADQQHGKLQGRQVQATRSLPHKAHDCFPQQFGQACEGVHQQMLDAGTRSSVSTGVENHIWSAKFSTPIPRILAIVRLARLHPGTFGANLADMLQRGLTFAEADQSGEFFVIAKQRLRQVWRPIRDQIAPVL